MMTRPRTHYILPAVLLSVLAILIFSDVGNAQDAQSETGTCAVLSRRKSRTASRTTFPPQA